MRQGMKHLRICGDPLYYFEDLPRRARDTQESVLVLHGFPDTPMSFAPLGAALAAQGYRVLRPYLPGYVPSVLRARASIEEVKKRLLEFLDATDCHRVHLVGHDWGAILSYALLTSAPYRFARAATISVPHLAHLLPRALTTPSQLLRSAYVLFFQLPFLPEHTIRLQLALVAKLCQRWSLGFAFSQAALAEIERCLRASGSAPFDYYRDLRRLLRPGATLPGAIETPLLYLHGSADGCIALEMAAGQERYFRGEFQAATLPCGHFPHMEIPEELAQQLLSWFGKPTRARAG